MTPEFWAALVGQTIIIVLAIVASRIHAEKRITTIETKVEHLEVEVGRLPGISRAVAKIEGILAAK
jgi:hypothetical protein